ncbi:MAG: hypothetical protein EPO26_04275 [Chloroflexota bacterium]|nr:MAG: hypothetical protein EPO26_04275 [Chloroflexota bacterium]
MVDRAGSSAGQPDDARAGPDATGGAAHGESHLERLEHALAAKQKELADARGEIDILSAQIETYADDFSRLYLEHHQESGAPVVADLADARARLEDASSRGRLYTVMYKKQADEATELAAQLKQTNEQLVTAQKTVARPGASSKATAGASAWWRRPVPFGLLSSGIGLLSGGLMYAQVLAPALGGGTPTVTPSIQVGLGTPVSALAFVASSNDGRNRRPGQDDAAAIAVNAFGTVVPAAPGIAPARASAPGTETSSGNDRSTPPRPGPTRFGATATPARGTAIPAADRLTGSLATTSGSSTPDTRGSEDNLATVTALRAALDGVSAAATISADSLGQARATATAASLELASARATTTRLPASAAPALTIPTPAAPSPTVAALDDRCWFELNVPALPPGGGWMIRFTQSSPADVLALWSSRVGGFTLHAASPAGGVGQPLAGMGGVGVAQSDVVLRGAPPATYALMLRNGTAAVIADSFVGLFYGRGGQCEPEPLGVPLAADAPSRAQPTASTGRVAAPSATIAATPARSLPTATVPPPTWTPPPVVLLARPLIDCQPYLRLPSGRVEIRPIVWLDRDYTQRGSARVRAVLYRPTDQLVDEYDVTPGTPAHSFSLDRPGVHRLEVTAAGADADANCSVPFVYEGG